MDSSRHNCDGHPDAAAAGNDVEENSGTMGSNDSTTRSSSANSSKKLSAYEDLRRQREHQGDEAVTAGWVKCPLCKVKWHSQKRYSLGRGLRMHFLAAHADVEDPSPWLTKAEQQAASGDVLHRKGPQKNAGAKPPMPPGLEAARDGDLEGLRGLLDSGAWKVEDTDNTGSLAVHWAAGGGHLDIVRWIVQELDPRQAVAPAAKRKKRDGRQPIHWAARNNRVAVIDFLLSGPHEEGNVKVDAGTFDGTTPLHLAAFGGSLEACEALLGAGASVSVLNDWLCDASHWAAMGGSVAVLELLEQRGAKFTGLQKEGHSALHKAAHRGHLEALEWLLAGPLSCPAARRQASGPDTDGFTPAEIARVWGHLECQALLEEQGCGSGT